MNYILAIFVPPLALFLTRRLGHAILSLVILAAAVAVFFFTLGFGAPVAALLVLVAIIHAIFVVHGARVDRRMDEKLKVMQDQE